MHPMCSGTVPRPGSNRSEHLFFLDGTCVVVWMRCMLPGRELASSSAATRGKLCGIGDGWHGAPGVTCTNGDRLGRAIEEEDAAEKGIRRGLTARPTYLPNLESFVISGMHVSRPTRGPMCRAQISDGRKQGIIFFFFEFKRPTGALKVIGCSSLRGGR